MSYTFKIDGFAFSSTSSDKVETVKRWFTECGYTLEKIKDNKIPDRHALMINLTCWGHCNIALSYWSARELRESLYKAYIKSLPKNSSKRVFTSLNDFNDEVLSRTGWNFS